MTPPYAFHTLKEYTEINLQKTVLWVFYATKTPPHIGISAQQAFFSLKSTGKDENIPTTRVLTTIHSKKIPTVLVEIDRPLSPIDLEKEYHNYQRISLGVNTCLSPIKKVFHCCSARQLSELLHMMHDQIKATAGTYLPATYRQLPSYSTADIENRIVQTSLLK